jgi:hypothetical protein
MSDLMVDFIMSLDGYGAPRAGPATGAWKGPEYLAWIGDDDVEEHLALMGATTYRLMSGFAAQMPDDPASRADGIAQDGVLLDPGGTLGVGTPSWCGATPSRRCAR